MATKIRKTFTFSFTVDVEYTPGRPPPACSNPSSPAFGDSGDSPEIEMQVGKDQGEGAELVDLPESLARGISVALEDSAVERWFLNRMEQYLGEAQSGD